MMKSLLKYGLKINVLKDDGGSAEMTIWEWEVNLADFSYLFLSFYSNDGGGADPRLKIIIDSTTELNDTYDDGFYTEKIDVTGYTGVHTIKLLFTEGGNGYVTDLTLWGVP